MSVEYKAEHSELATLMASGEVKLGMLPEPNVTATMAKNENLRVALNLTEEWKNLRAWSRCGLHRGAKGLL